MQKTDKICAGLGVLGAAAFGVILLRTPEVAVKMDIHSIVIVDKRATDALKFILKLRGNLRG